MTATVTLPCDYCRRAPFAEIPVEAERVGDAWVLTFDWHFLNLTVAVHAKQHAA